MRVQKLSNEINAKEYLTKLGVDGGGIGILASKMQSHLILITDLHVGAANILKQDALSIGADLAVPRGTVIAVKEKVDCLLIATQKQLLELSKKELAQPFGLKELAQELKKISQIKEIGHVEIMGIINANNDSFYSLSRFKNEFAIEAIEKMIQDGGDIIDIGGVSSRPNAPIVSSEEEFERLKPIVDAIYEQRLYEKAKFSLDSYEPKVIDYALKKGFKIINDITGLANDEVCKLCASYNATAVIMHMQGTPQTMQKYIQYDDLISEVYNFFENRIHKAQSFGINDTILDVGIGFGKTLEHNLSLIHNLEHFMSLQKPLLVGASRKSVIDAVYASKVEQRLPGTLAIHLKAIQNGAAIVRVHDVSEHKQAIMVQAAINKSY